MTKFQLDFVQGKCFGFAFFKLFEVSRVYNTENMCRIVIENIYLVIRHFGMWKMFQSFI